MIISDDRDSNADWMRGDAASNTVADKALSGSRAETRSIASVALMHGAREIVITHGDDRYRLRVTASNKLILTK